MRDGGCVRDGVCDGCVSVSESLLLYESLVILKKKTGQVRLAITRYYHYEY